MPECTDNGSKWIDIIFRSELEMDIIEERYAASCGRVREIAALQDVALDYKDYFKRTAEFILLVTSTCDNRTKKKKSRGATGGEQGTVSGYQRFKLRSELCQSGVCL